MIVIKSKGSFKKTQDYLNGLSKIDFLNILKHYGEVGVRTLAAYTPTDTGLTAGSWSYTIEEANGRYSIVWSNSNINDYVQIAVILQYGHATRNGGWVEGTDYINPSIRPIFEQMTTDVWRRVRNG